MELIKNAMLDHIEIFLKANHEFYPFGILLDNDLQINSITVIDQTIDESIIENRNQIEKLVLKEKKYDSGGFCVDTTTPTTSRIQMNFISKQSEGWIQFYLPYNIKNGAINYGSFEDC